MSTLSSRSTLIWLVAETEAAAAGFSEIAPWHLIGCWKACDLDVAKFVTDAPGKVSRRKSESEEDFANLAGTVPNAQITQMAREALALRFKFRPWGII
jgi:hypothetical protein